MFDDPFLFNLIFSWTNVIGGSPLLLKKFKLQLDSKSIKTLAVDDWPNVPIKNIQILQKDGRKFYKEAYISIVNKYRTSVEDLAIEHLELSFNKMKKLLENMENLRKLTFNDVGISFGVIKPLQLQKLSALSIISRERKAINWLDEILRVFMFNSTIETLRIAASDRNWSNTMIFHGFIKTLPKIKHLKLEGDIGNEVVRSDLPLKLETLHVDSLDANDNVQFLLNQRKLKVLRLKRLPRVNSTAFVRTVYEHLDTFYLKDVLLIRNFQPQHVEENLELDWKAGLEILKRGRCEWNF
jgi:hypothetical protein